MAKRAKKIGANTRADTSSLGSLRKIKGNRTIKERANTFFIDLGLLLLYSVSSDKQVIVFLPHTQLRMLAGFIGEFCYMECVI